MVRILYLLIGIILLPVLLVSWLLLLAAWVLSMVVAQISRSERLATIITQPFFLLTVYSGMWWQLAFTVKSTLSEQGINLQSFRRETFVNWDDLKKITIVPRGLSTFYELALKDGPKLIAHGIEIDELKQHCERHDIKNNLT